MNLDFSSDHILDNYAKINETTKFTNEQDNDWCMICGKYLGELEGDCIEEVCPFAIDDDKNNAA